MIIAVIILLFVMNTRYYAQTRKFVFRKNFVATTSKVIVLTILTKKIALQVFCVVICLFVFLNEIKYTFTN